MQHRQQVRCFLRNTSIVIPKEIRNCIALRISQGVHAIPFQEVIGFTARIDIICVNCCGNFVAVHIYKIPFPIRFDSPIAIGINPVCIVICVSTGKHIAIQVNQIHLAASRGWRTPATQCSIISICSSVDNRHTHIIRLIGNKSIPGFINQIVFAIFLDNRLSVYETPSAVEKRLCQSVSMLIHVAVQRIFPIDKAGCRF